VGVQVADSGGEGHRFRGLQANVFVHRKRGHAIIFYPAGRYEYGELITGNYDGLDPQVSKRSIGSHKFCLRVVDGK